MFNSFWLITLILWPVKHDHLTQYILVLVYYHFHDNNRLETFRIVFFYASRFYYPNHAFDNSGRITIHGCFIKLNMHRNNKMIKQCVIIYISNIKSEYIVLSRNLAYFHISSLDDLSNEMKSPKYVFGSLVRPGLLVLCDGPVVITMKLNWI